MKFIYFLFFLGLQVLNVNAENYLDARQKALTAADLYKKKATIFDYVSVLGIPTYIVKPQQQKKLELSFLDGVNTYAVWDHFGCTHTFVAFDSSGIPRGAVLEWSTFTEERAKNEGCPDAYYAKEKSLLLPFSCKKNDHKFCVPNKAVTDSDGVLNYLNSVRMEIQYGERLLKKRPSTFQIGEHSRKMQNLMNEGRKYSASSPYWACSAVGARAWSFWLNGMVAKFNKSKDSDSDYARLRILYQQGLDECRSTVKSIN